jgi:hypothetical protein
MGPVMVLHFSEEKFAGHPEWLPDTIDTPTSGSHLAYVLGVGGARVAAPGVLGRSDQLHSYSETVGSDWSGDLEFGDHSALKTISQRPIIF